MTPTQREQVIEVLGFCASNRWIGTEDAVAALDYDTTIGDLARCAFNALSGGYAFIKGVHVPANEPWSRESYAEAGQLILNGWDPDEDETKDAAK